MPILVSPEDVELLNSRRWYINKAGYAQHGKDLLHRLIMEAPFGVFVDHINRDTTDNRRENLRLCTHAQNMQNSKVRAHSGTGVKGVQKHANRYRARIRDNGRQVTLGNFLTIEEAKAAYDAAAERLFGEFARK